MPGNLVVVVDLPGEGLEWAAATQSVPGARIETQVEVVQHPGPQGVVLRTRLDVDALQSPYVRFLLRFYDQFRAVSATIEGGRLEVRGTPRVEATAEQDASRIRAFLRKLDTPGKVRIERVAAPRAPSP